MAEMLYRKRGQRYVPDPEQEPHMAVHYWCGNGVAGKRNLTFLAAPPSSSRLLRMRSGRSALAS